MTRFVHLPTTPAALALADALHREFGTDRPHFGRRGMTTWIARGTRKDLVVDVPNTAAEPSATFLAKYRRARVKP